MKEIYKLIDIQVVTLLQGTYLPVVALIMVFAIHATVVYLTFVTA